MNAIILATEEQKQEIKAKHTHKETPLLFVQNISEIKNCENFDVVFLLTDNLSKTVFRDYSGKPVIINSVVNTLSLLELPSNYSRINGWPGFLKRPTWEVASNNKDLCKPVFIKLGWEILFVKDEPGLVAARVISMIINEAYFALGENVSTVNEIDLAMKLGTNYPIGPFEWQNKIGIKKIHALLKKLSETDRRYLAAPGLEEIFKKSA